LMQDRIYRIVEIFLHRTAGPYIRVRSSGQPNDPVASGFPQIAEGGGSPPVDRPSIAFFSASRDEIVPSERKRGEQQGTDADWND